MTQEVKHSKNFSTQLSNSVLHKPRPKGKLKTTQQIKHSKHSSIKLPYCVYLKVERQSESKSDKRTKKFQEFRHSIILHHLS